MDDLCEGPVAAELHVGVLGPPALAIFGVLGLASCTLRTGAELVLQVYPSLRRKLRKLTPSRGGLENSRVKQLPVPCPPHMWSPTPVTDRSRSILRAAETLLELEKQWDVSPIVTLLPLPRVEAELPRLLAPEEHLGHGQSREVFRQRYVQAHTPHTKPPQLSDYSLRGRYRDACSFASSCTAVL